jgi:hypothetical protein
MQMVAIQKMWLDDAREIIERSFPSVRYEPRDTEAWDEGYRRFKQLI